MILRFALFLTVMTAITVAGHVYIYRRLIRDTVRSKAWRRVGLVVIATLGVLLVGGRFLQRVFPGPLAEVVGAISFVWMGLALFLLLTLLAASGGQRVAEWVRARRGRGEVDGERRLFLSRTVAGGAALASTALGGYGAFRAYTAPEISEVVVKLPRLPKALDGITLVQLTDIHVGNMIERRFMDELVRRANALKPDLVAITGDLVDGDVPHLGNAVAALGNLSARYGSYFVTGNHEYYSGDVPWTAFLQKIGVNVLRNRHVSIGDAGASFDLVGVDDWSQRDTAQGYDLDAALAGRDADRAAVLLAHQPANFAVAAQRGMGLQLSGHTHGGQLFPATLFVMGIWEHFAGLYQEHGSHIYVSRGCGFWGPPMRVGSPPELVKIVLTS